MRACVEWVIVTLSPSFITVGPICWRVSVRAVLCFGVLAVRAVLGACLTYTYIYIYMGLLEGSGSIQTTCTRLGTTRPPGMQHSVVFVIVQYLLIAKVTLVSEIPSC
jgi:hypothetical protein